MITEIGITAGKIWECLDRNGSVDVPDLCEHLDESLGAVLMSLGWLAREGHVILDQEEEKGYQVRLREQKTEVI